MIKRTPSVPNSPVKEKKAASLAPPCPFVRGIDPQALQSFREGNLLYRMGSALGSKGEICNLPHIVESETDLPAMKVGGADVPPRTDSESPY